jgi:hypothetical protein
MFDDWPMILSHAVRASGPSSDPAAVSPDRIASLQVIATIVDGEIRYSALG